MPKERDWFSAIYFVESQNENDESTTVSMSTSSEGVAEEGTTTIAERRTLANSIKTDNHNQTSDSTEQSNESSKQRIIIALAVLSFALAVLLGFFVSIVVCQWFRRDEHVDNRPSARTTKSRSDQNPTNYNQHERSYPQTVKLWLRNPTRLIVLIGAKKIDFVSLVFDFSCWV